MDDLVISNEAAPKTEEQITVCDIRFRFGCKTYYFHPNGLPLKLGDHVIIDTARGAEYGYCCGKPHRVPVASLVAPLRNVLRLATPEDEEILRKNERLEKAAYQNCLEKIERLGLDMQLVSCESAFDGSKLLFCFTAEARVDFRELVKQLAGTFHTRIELRQIGVRDKAKMVGGLGICGRPFCCGQFLTDFAPVSIKMAKTQNLSLNPAKISGTCGRLMCCLKYEQEAYESLLKTSPKPESFVDTPDGRGTITEVNLMKQSVKVRLERDPDEIRCFRNEQIAVLRSGKAKKTDAPIPDDLAPISGEAAAAEPARAERHLSNPVVASVVVQPVAAAEVPSAAKQPKPAESERQPGKKRRQNPARKHAESAENHAQKHAEAPKFHEAVKHAEAAKQAAHERRPSHDNARRQGAPKKKQPAAAQAAQSAVQPAAQPVPVQAQPVQEGAKAGGKQKKRHYYYHKPKNRQG